jgi:hypothetical protein
MGSYLMRGLVTALPTADEVLPYLPPTPTPTPTPPKTEAVVLVSTIGVAEGESIKRSGRFLHLYFPILHSSKCAR